MDKRFPVCAAVVALASLLLGLLVHGVLLRDAYAALAAQSGLARGANLRDLLPWFVAAHLACGTGLTWLYRQVSPRGARPLTRGLRFGAALVLAAVLPGALALYALQPWPAGLMVQQLAYAGASTLVLALLLGYLDPGRTRL